MPDQDTAHALPPQLRGVLIQIAGSQLLLPNAAIAEVLSFSDPEALPGAEPWLLGQIRWRGWQVPLVDYSRLSGAPAIRAAAATRRRVLVVKATGATPFVAFLADGYPRLVSLTAQALATLPDTRDASHCVYARAQVGDEAVVIPDLQAIEARIAQTRQRAA